MAKRDGEKGAREVGFRTELDTLTKQVRRCGVVARRQMGRAEKVEIMLLERRIEANGLLDIGNSGKRLPAIDAGKAARAVRVSMF